KPEPEDAAADAAAEEPAAGRRRRSARELYEMATRGFLEAGNPGASPDEIRRMLQDGFSGLPADERRAWDERSRADGLATVYAPDSDAAVEGYRKLHVPRRRLARWCQRDYTVVSTRVSVSCSCYELSGPKTYLHYQI
ncbi:hypothetical protein THAOC_27777, partial [Thalassiosira oceanica]